MKGPTISDLMDRLRLRPADLARIYSALGDPADLPTIDRRIRRRMKPDAEPSGEAVAFLNLLSRIQDATTALGSVLPKETDHGRRGSRTAR